MRLTALKRSLNVLFFGTDQFSMATLKRLHEEKFNVSICCKDVKRNSVRRFSLEHPQVAFYSYPIKDEDLRRGAFDVGVVASFGHLIPSRIIEAFPKRHILNVHGSVLPAYRGAAPVAHAIANGDVETGVSIMKIAPKKFDVGDVLAVERIKIAPDAFHDQLRLQLADVGANLLVKVLKDLDSYEEQRRRQSDEKATFAPIVSQSYFNIDWSSISAEELWRRFRGFSTFGKFNSRWLDTGQNVKFDSMTKPDGEFEDILPPEADPGRAVYVKRKKRRKIFIKCNVGWASFEAFHYEKHKTMSALEFYNGFMSKHNKSGKKLYFGC